jgi:hypothetical protein
MRLLLEAGVHGSAGRFDETGPMAFGQQSGPPAASQQIRELLALLQEAGHTDFRHARGEMGFTQRQAGGKFTRDEAAAFIDRLQEPSSDPNPPVEAAPRRAPAPRADGPGTATRSGLSVLEQAMRGMPAEQLATELRRRGWLVLEP